MNTKLWPGFIDILKADIVPALGCTEPVVAALAGAMARERFQGKIDNIIISVSPNLMKNAMGVMVPGTGMVGLPIATAVGIIAGDVDAKLEVLNKITADDVIEAKKMLKSGIISTQVASVTQPLYAKVTLSNSEHNISVTISGTHTHLSRIEEDGITTYLDENISAKKKTKNYFFNQATFQDIYDFAVFSPIENMAFIYQAYQLNNALSQEGLKHSYGLQIGMTYQRNVEKGLLANDVMLQIMSRTAAASDARMGGAMKPAVSNSGSGNQGIAATMPVVVVAEHLKVERETLIRALVLSHLMAIYIKKDQHKLSALCGATTASMGATAGITWLLGGDAEKISYAISSMIGDVAGVICDGAKASCAMKVSSSATAAFKAALLALEGIRVTGNEGIVCDSVEDSIQNLTALANGSMTQIDTQILDLMVKKVS